MKDEAADIVLVKSDSSDDEQDVKVPVRRTKAGGKGKGKQKAGIQITRKTAVDELQSIDDAMEFWPVPREGEPTIGYLMDFRGCPDRLVWKEDRLTIDGYIKKQVRTC